MSDLRAGPGWLIAETVGHDISISLKCQAAKLWDQILAPLAVQKITA